jgi:hypothetical protein
MTDGQLDRGAAEAEIAKLSKDVDVTIVEWSIEFMVQKFAADELEIPDYQRPDMWDSPSANALETKS